MHALRSGGYEDSEEMMPKELTLEVTAKVHGGVVTEANQSSNANKGNHLKASKCHGVPKHAL